MHTFTRAATIISLPLLAFSITACGSDTDSANSTTANTPAAPVTPTNVTAGNEEFCAALAEFDNANNADLDDDDTNDVQTEAFAKNLQAFNAENAQTMPADIKPAFDTLETDLQALLATNDPQNGTDAATAIRQAAQLIASLKQIDTWSQANCGFEF